METRRKASQPTPRRKASETEDRAMPSGGARVRSGPPPDPNSLRSAARDTGDWTTLPAEGRKGRAPDWPWSKQTRRETALWQREWKRPQALMWERQGQQLEVALYVRRLAE